MDKLIDNINTHIKRTVEKQVLEYFSQYEDQISEKISSAYKLNIDNVKQMVTDIIHDGNNTQEEKPPPTKIVCVGKTKAGKPCKYTCVANNNMCNKHMKAKNEGSGSEDQTTCPKIPKKGECSKTKKPLKEDGHVVLSSLPPDEASWFQKYSNVSNYTQAYYPDIQETGSESTEDCIVNE